RCPTCRRRWSYATARLRWRLLLAFCLAVPAHQAARTFNCSYPTAYLVYARARRIVLALADGERRQVLIHLGLGGLRQRRDSRSVAVFGYEDGVFVLLPVGDATTLCDRFEAAGVTAAVYAGTGDLGLRAFARVGTAPAAVPGIA